MQIDVNVPRGPRAMGFAVDELDKRFRASLEEPRLTAMKTVVAELVENALHHGRGSIRLEVALDGELIRGQVSDEGSGFATAIRNGSVASGGLARVHASTTAWGVAEGRTHVWFEIAMSPRPDLDRAARRRDVATGVPAPGANGDARGPVVPRGYP